IRIGRGASAQKTRCSVSCPKQSSANDTRIQQKITAIHGNLSSAEGESTCGWDYTATSRSRNFIPCTLIGCAKAPNGQIPPRPDPRKPSAAPQEIECGRDPSCLAANRNSQAPCTRCASVLAIWHV